MPTNLRGKLAGRVLVVAALASLAWPAIARAQSSNTKGKPLPGKTVFVTSESYDGNLGGLAGADFKCQTLAAAAGLKGTFRAWLSTDKDQPNGRFLPSVGPYRRVDGAVVADDWDDLVSTFAGGYLKAPIDVDERGQAVPSSGAWTGTNSLGIGTSNRCNNWLSSSTQLLGVYGLTESVDYSWTVDTEVTTCNNVGRLYCFEQ